jgi:hypothetical protein
MISHVKYESQEKIWKPKHPAIDRNPSSQDRIIEADTDYVA